MSAHGFAADSDALCVMSANAATSFYTSAELAELGLRKFGENVLISRKASIYAPQNIEIGSHVRIDDFCVISAGGGITIGNYVHIAPFCGLYGGSGIEMADFSGLASRVALYSESDDFMGDSLTNPMIPMDYKPAYERGKISVGRHVIVGTGVTILPGITLAEGASVGAHSLVSKDCEEWGFYFGTPAKLLKARSRNLLALEAKFIETRRSNDKR
jgi:acetyltransferase-like isoleucine patch superfamily enzyme